MNSGGLSYRFRSSIAFAIASLVLALGPSLCAQSFSVLHYFSGGWEVSHPYGGLVADGNTLYGTTLRSIFKINTDGSNYAVLKHYTNSAGGLDGMMTPLILDGNTLYGTAVHGGSNHLGTIFKINTDGSGYTILKTFTGAPDGWMEWKDDLILSGATLYGSTVGGGTNNLGTIYKINTDGSGYSILKHFEGTPNGRNPRGRLVLGGNTIYGGATGGATNDGGVIFKLNTDGSGYSILRHFGAPDVLYDAPDSGLILNGDILYGTTSSGGSNQVGAVFKIKTDGSEFRILHDFEYNPDGSRPNEGVILVDDTLYGTTSLVTGSDNGTVFSVKTNGSDFAILKSFSAFANANYRTNSDGAIPMAGLLASGGALYGTAAFGGIYHESSSSSGYGTVFKITLPQLLQIHTSDNGFGIQSNSFGFNISGASNLTIVVEASTNLAASVWLPLRTNTLGAAPIHFSDSSWTNHSTRFYRVRSQ